MSGPHAGQVSLYPSAALVGACRATVLTPSDRHSLRHALADLIATTVGSLGNIDLSSIVKQFGLNAWQHVYGLVVNNDASRHTAAVSRYVLWLGERLSQWEDPDDININLLTADALSGAATSPPATWACGNCELRTNPTTGQHCQSCKRPQSMWTCQACSCSNMQWLEHCLACRTGKDASAALEISKAPARKAKMEAAAAQEAEKVALQLAAAAAATKAEEERVAAILSNGSGGQEASAVKETSSKSRTKRNLSSQHVGRDDSPRGERQRAREQRAELDESVRVVASFEVGSFLKSRDDTSTLTLSKLFRVTRVKPKDPAGDNKQVFVLSLSDGSTLSSKDVAGGLVKATPEEELKEKAARIAAGCHDIGSTVRRSGRCQGGLLMPGQSGVIENYEKDDYRLRINGVIDSYSYSKFEIELVDPSVVAQKEKVRSALIKLLEFDTSLPASLAALQTSGASQLGKADSILQPADIQVTESAPSTTGPMPDTDDDELSCLYDYSETISTISKQAVKCDMLGPTFELDRNTSLSESYFHASSQKASHAGTPIVTHTPLHVSSQSLLSRSTSVEFYSGDVLKPLDNVANLCQFVDRAGNSAGHHAVFMRLWKTAKALFAAGASRWLRNKDGDTPVGMSVAINAGLPPSAGRTFAGLHKILGEPGFINPALLPACVRALDYQPADEYVRMRDAVFEGDEERADKELQLAASAANPHVQVYRSLFLLRFDYGLLQAQAALRDYEALLDTVADGTIDPVYFYVRYLLWKRVAPNARPSFAKKDRIAAARALLALREYPPESAAVWLTASDDIDVECKRVYPGFMDAVAQDDEDEDDYSSLIPPPGPDDPETLWDKQKTIHSIQSPAMDKLMRLTGLKQVKQIAIQVATKVLLRPPADLVTTTSMNFLFVGNPGCGKTTVANLLAQAMVELGYRKNPKPVLVSAADILAAKDPAGEFGGMVKAAEGGTLFIDEAYLFDPAPKGTRANDSNRVLDTLMQVSESMKDSTTFILAGYKDDIMGLLTYNPGFPSRFPKMFTFDFQDYTEAQLCQILCTKTKEKGYKFESKAACGVPIARILSRRMHRGAEKKGFGNGRLVEKVLDQCLITQQARLGRLLLHNIPISDHDYRTLLRADTVGERPRLDESQAFRDLNAMVGLNQVKATVRSFMELQLQNYDAEMRGEQVQRVSMNRVFYGNPGKETNTNANLRLSHSLVACGILTLPGTGKTTVAKLFGLMLKEFGFLSDGDYTQCSPSDLMGQAQGEAAVLTKKYLEDAKGKVLFIDEAYGLDPKRSGNTYAQAVLDTLVEKLDGGVGADICVIMAGYQPQIEDLFRNCNNPGLIGRMNLDQALVFEDFDDAALKMVMKSLVLTRGLSVKPVTLDYAIKLIAKKRKLDGFRNAAEVGMLLDRSVLKLTARKTAGGVTEPTLLTEADFMGEETNADRAYDVFAGMENMEHLIDFIRKREAVMAAAKEDGSDPAKILETAHMVFVGPPGTGKSTCAAKFGEIFKQLDLLPRGHVEMTLGSTLIDRYVGGTGKNVLDTMRRAKNGILFIDEVYSLANSTYGLEAIQALLDNITAPEFKGKLIVIIAGYKADVERLFTLNPGFQSRFDKVRIEFPEWTAEMASRATVNAIERAGKALTEECKDCLPQLYDNLRSLPNWGSAREVYELVIPGMYEARAVRCSARAQSRRMLGATGPDDMPVPYEAEDARKIFESLITRRGGSLRSGTITDRSEFAKALDASNKAGRLLVVLFSAVWSPECMALMPDFLKLPHKHPQIMFVTVGFDCSEVIKAYNVSTLPSFKLFDKGKELKDLSSRIDALGDLEAMLASWEATVPTPPPTQRTDSLPQLAAPTSGCIAPAPQKIKIKEKILRIDGNPNGDDDDVDFWGALEAACAALGYSLEQIAALLESPDFPSDEILQQMQVGGADVSRVKDALRQQRAGVLAKVKESIKEAKRKKTAEEAAILERVRKIGRCPMGFEWIKVDGGYRCGGGSHMVADHEVNCV